MQSINVTALGADAVFVMPSPFFKANIQSVVWSYSSTPTNGKLTISSGGVTVFEIDIAAAGHRQLPSLDVESISKDSLTVTLKSGGALVTGKLNVIYILQN